MLEARSSKLRHCSKPTMLASIFGLAVLLSSTFLEVHAQSCTSLGSPTGLYENTLTGYYPQSCDMDVPVWTMRVDSGSTLENNIYIYSPTVSILAASNTIYNSGTITSYNGSTIRNTNTGTSIQNNGSIINFWDQAGIYNASGSQLNVVNNGDISGNSFGIYSDGSLLIQNYGVVLGTSGSMPVGIDATQATIYNWGNGVISSSGSGIRLRGNSVVENWGGQIGVSYSGTSPYSGVSFNTLPSQVGIEIQESDNVIYNRLNPMMPFNPGIISGSQSGIWITGGGNNNGVVNYGSIYGDNRAIEIDSTYLNTTTTIVNYGEIQSNLGVALKLSGSGTEVNNISTGLIHSLGANTIEDSSQVGSSITINNYGSIEAATGNAINFSGPGQNTINNYATTDSYINTGKIVANTVSAIILSNGTNVINNYGIIGSNSTAIEILNGINTVNNYDLITSPSVAISLGMDGVINNYGRIGDLNGTHQSGVPTSQAISIIGSNNTINNLNVPNLGVGTIEGSSSAIFIADGVTNNQINNAGFISGTASAIAMGTASPGGYHTIQNTGMIWSSGINSGEGVAVELAGGYNNVYNAGGIYGTDTGIAIYGDNNTVVNQGSGVIQGGVAGINITPSSPLMGTTQITNYGVIRGVDSILTNTGSPVGHLIVSNAGTLDGNLDLSTPTNARLEIFGDQAQILSGNAIVGGSNAIFSIGSMALGTAQFTLRSDVGGFNQMQILSGSTLTVAPNQVTNYAQTFIGVGNFLNDGRLIIPPGHQLNIFGNYSQSGILELGVASTSSYGQLTIQGNANFGNSIFRIASGSTIMPYTTYASVLNVMGAVAGSMNVDSTYAQNNYAYTYSLVPQAGNPNIFDLSLGGGTLILTTYEISQGATLLANALTNLNYTFINNYGTLTIPATVSMPVTGLYTQTGALSLGIGSLNQYGRLNIQGAADLSGGSLQVADGSTINPGQYSGIVTATGGITGTLGSSIIRAPHRSYNYSTSLSADNQSLNLTIAPANYSKPLLQSNANLGLLNMAGYSDHLIQKRFGSTSFNQSEQGVQSSFWMTPFGEKAKLLSDASLSSGYRMDRSGLAIGADTYLSKQWLLGLAMSTGQGRFTGMDASTHDRANIKNHEVIAYSEYALHPMIDARVSHAQGWANTTGSRYDNNMEVAAGSDYRSRYYHSSFELALKHHISTEFRIIPSWGLAYTHVKSDPYLDTSRLGVHEEKSDALVGLIKANFEYLKDANKLSIQVGLKHDWKAQRSQQHLMAADNHVFLGQGVEKKPNRALLGLSYQRQLKKDLEFDFAYDLDRSSNYISHAANAKLKMLF